MDIRELARVQVVAVTVLFFINLGKIRALV